MADKPWSGRFAEGLDPTVEAFTESVSIDGRLYAEDIAGSIAHARMLARVGLLTADEAEAVVAGLRAIRTDIENGTFRFDPALEDVHMNIEVELTRRIGEPGKKLHTARSRNDQVATDLRLYVRQALDGVRHDLAELMRALVDKASQEVDTIVPGMTHLQFAQPVSFAHHLLAYFEMFARDEERVRDALVRVNISPLGAAALAGTPFPIDRGMTAEALGFSAPARNSMDAVADRDFAVEAVFVLSLTMQHLSRLAEEIIIWNAPFYGLVELPDAYTTGSSIMPQKKNPDVAELIRGKVGRVYGHLFGLLTMLKALPLTYNRDMQEDKLPVMDSLDTARACLTLMAGLVRGMRVKSDVARQALQKGFITATDIADYLAGKGVAFRDAHRITGEIVAMLVRQNRTIADLTLTELTGFSTAFAEDVFAFITPEASVDRRLSYGGTARPGVRAAIAEARQRLEGLTP
ncbi:MAG TPA: argininosuccinate lyase [Deltaproteobacteria bacterium]|nr:argininosuccinate lyase [Deltaproteobacteria bacterium]